MPIPDKKCGAKTRKGTACLQPAMLGGDRCRLHGGKSLVGVAHPNFKHGRTSKYVYDRLQETYEENLKDQKLLGLVDEIAVLRAMVQDLMEKGESGKQWKDALAAYKPVRRAHQKLARAVGSDALREAMDLLAPASDELEEVLKEGAHDASLREEIKGDFERVRKLVDSEHKHRIDHRMALTQEQVTNHVAAVVGIMRGHIKDRGVLNDITRDLRALDSRLPHEAG